MQFKLSLIFEVTLVAALTLAPIRIFGPGCIPIEFVLLNAMALLGPYVLAMYSTFFSNYRDGELHLLRSSPLRIMIRLWVYALLATVGMWLYAIYTSFAV